jgi:hypothetical protein
MESTTVKVSKGLHARTLEDTIRLLLKRHRKELLDEAFGADRGKVSSFSEDDRGEDSS